MKTIRQFFFALICLTTSVAPLHAQWVHSMPFDGICQSFALSGTNLFAGTRGGVFLSTNNGTSWTAVNTGLTSTWVWSLAVSGTNLFAGTWGGGVFRSTDNGTNWTAVNTGLTNTDVRSLAVSGTNLFAGTWGGGVFLSSDNGANWTAVNTGLTNTRVLSFAVSGTNLFAGTDGGGVFLSTNNGTSWTATALRGLIVRSLAFSGTNLFAGTILGVFLSTNNGTSWTAVNTGLPIRSVSSLAVSGANLFAGTRGRGVFLSTNNGTSWTEVNTGITNVADLSIFSLGVSGTHLFAGTVVGGVWRRWLLEMTQPIIDVPYTQTFDAATFPVEWAQTFAGWISSNRWSVSNSSNAGGTPHELRARVENQTGTSRLIAGRFNTAGMAALSLSFRMFYDDFGAGCTMKIQSSADGITWTDEAFSFASGSGNRGPEVVNTTIVNNVGAETFIAWVIDGDHSQFDNWYIDNVEVRLPNVGTGVGNNLPEDATVVYFANGMLHMQFATEERNRRLQVIDISGRMVLSKSLHGLGNMVSVPLQIDNGVYIVRITGETSAISRRILVR